MVGVGGVMLTKGSVAWVIENIVEIFNMVAKRVYWERSIKCVIHDFRQWIWLFVQTLNTVSS